MGKFLCDLVYLVFLGSTCIWMDISSPRFGDFLLCFYWKHFLFLSHNFLMVIKILSLWYSKYHVCYFHKHLKTSLTFTESSSSSTLSSSTEILFSTQSTVPMRPSTELISCIVFFILIISVCLPLVFPYLHWILSSYNKLTSFFHPDVCCVLLEFMCAFLRYLNIIIIIFIIVYLGFFLFHNWDIIMGLVYFGGCEFFSCSYHWLKFYYVLNRNCFPASGGSVCSVLQRLGCSRVLVVFSYFRPIRT